MRLIDKLVSLKVVDSAWLQHLETMDHLRDGIGLRGYGQRDPLVEYKSEAFRLFKQLQAGMSAEIATTIFKVQFQEETPIEAPKTEITEGAKYATSMGASEGPAVITKKLILLLNLKMPICHFLKYLKNSKKPVKTLQIGKMFLIP